jgi:hypothetical protein
MTAGKRPDRRLPVEAFSSHPLPTSSTMSLAT